MFVSSSSSAPSPSSWVLVSLSTYLRIGSLNFMANRWENKGNCDRLNFLGPQKSLQMMAAAIHFHLLLGRKAMTNLESILKSRDFTLLTKVHIVKAMLFPVVMYRCESWTIKKAEHKALVLLNCGVGENS